MLLLPLVIPIEPPFQFMYEGGGKWEEEAFTYDLTRFSDDVIVVARLSITLVCAGFHNKHRAGL